MSKEKELNNDYLKVDQPKADVLFSNPNALEDALDDLEAYEVFSTSDEYYNSTDGGPMLVKKHEPFADADKAKVVKKASEDESMKEFSVKEKDGKVLSEKELNEILKDSDAYAEYLGLADDLEVGHFEDIKKH